LWFVHPVFCTTTSMHKKGTLCLFLCSFAFKKAIRVT